MGNPGSYERTIFRAAATAPATPTAPASVALGANPTLPANWSATPPSGDTAIWASIQRVARGSLFVVYTAPRRWDGVDGTDGMGGGGGLTVAALDALPATSQPGLVDSSVVPGVAEFSGTRVLRKFTLGQINTYIQALIPGGGGGGLTAAGINALTEIGADEIHSNDNLPGTATVGGLAVLRKFSLSRITNFLRSSVGLGKELVPEAAPAHSGRIPIVNAGGTGYQLALYPNVVAGTPTLSRLPGGVPAVTDRWVRIISPYHQGSPDSFTLTVGFSPDGMLAGYNRLGSEEFGSIAFNQADVLPPFVNVLGTAVSTDDYGIDSDVQFYSKADAEEWKWLRVDNRDYLFGDVLFDTGWFRRITNGPRFTGGETDTRVEPNPRRWLGIPEPTIDRRCVH